MKKVIALLFFLLAAAVVIFYFMYPAIKSKQSTPAITSFEQCAAAGYPVMQSYPRQCTLPSGQFFVEQVVPGK